MQVCTYTHRIIYDDELHSWKRSSFSVSPSFISFGLSLLSPSLVILLERHDVHSDDEYTQQSIISVIALSRPVALPWMDSIAPLTWRTTKHFIVIPRVCVSAVQYCACVRLVGSRQIWKAAVTEVSRYFPFCLLKWYYHRTRLLCVTNVNITTFISIVPSQSYIHKKYVLACLVYVVLFGARVKGKAKEPEKFSGNVIGMLTSAIKTLKLWKCMLDGAGGGGEI